MSEPAKGKELKTTVIYNLLTSCGGFSVNISMLDPTGENKLGLYETVKRKRGRFLNRPRFVKELPDYSLFYPAAGSGHNEKGVRFHCGALIYRPNSDFG